MLGRQHVRADRHRLADLLPGGACGRSRAGRRDGGVVRRSSYLRGPSRWHRDLLGEKRRRRGRQRLPRLHRAIADRGRRDHRRERHRRGRGSYLRPPSRRPSVVLGAARKKRRGRNAHARAHRGDQRRGVGGCGVLPRVRDPHGRRRRVLGPTIGRSSSAGFSGTVRVSSTRARRWTCWASQACARSKRTGLRRAPSLQRASRAGASARSRARSPRASRAFADAGRDEAELSRRRTGATPLVTPPCSRSACEPPREAARTRMASPASAPRRAREPLALRRRRRS